MNHDEMLERIRRAHDALGVLAMRVSAHADLPHGRMSADEEMALDAVRGLDELLDELEDELDS